MCLISDDFAEKFRETLHSVVFLWFVFNLLRLSLTRIPSRKWRNKNSSFNSKILYDHICINTCDVRQAICTVWGHFLDIVQINSLHKWRIDLKNNTLYVLGLVLVLPDKGFFTWMWGLGCKSIDAIYCHEMSFFQWHAGHVEIVHPELPGSTSRHNIHFIEQT